MWSARSTCLRAANFRPTARKGAWRSLHTATGSSAGGTEDPNVYCRDFVRTHDYESYLISQFYPKKKRNGYFALKAFYVREVRTLGTRVYLTMVCVLGRASDGPGLGVERYARKNEDAVLEGRRQEFGRRACIPSELQWDLD